MTLLRPVQTIRFQGSDFWFQKLEAGVQTVRFQSSLFVVRMSEGHFVLCSHDPFFRTNKESSIWRQNNHAKFVGAFHLSRRVSDETRACSISIRFFKITDPFDGRSFLMCSHDPFFGTNKNRILKNGSCKRAFIIADYEYAKIFRFAVWM